MLARVETLAPLENNLISCLTNLLAQFGGHLGLCHLEAAKKEVSYLMVNAKNQESKLRRTLGARMKSVHAL